MRSARWLVLLGCAAGVLGRVPVLAGQHFAAVDSLLAAQDTSTALEALEAMVRRDLHDAEAHYRAGVLYLTRHQAGTDLSPNRRKADEHFRYATRFAPDSAKYWLGLADVFRSENIVTARVQVAKVLRRARQAAEKAGGGPDLAEAAYRQARGDWGRWGYLGRQYRRRDIGGPSGSPDADRVTQDPEAAFKALYVEVPGAGVQYLELAELNLHTALGIAPSRLDIAGLLVVVMGEQRRWEEAVAVTRRLVMANPDSGGAWALHGLALTRSLRWREAQAAFNRAFPLMSDEERAPFGDLGPILRAADRVRYRQMTPGQQRQLDTLYWRVAQPLTLTGTNEVQIEYYARLVYAKHAWTDPWRGHDGIATDKGVVYVAYGPPDVQSSVAWMYRASRLMFAFGEQPGFARSFLQNPEAFRVARIGKPALFENVPLVRHLDTILVQTTRFRAGGDSTALAIFGAIPLQRMADSVAVRNLPLTSGAVILDQAGRELGRNRREERLASGRDARTLQYRSWRLAVPPGEYVLRVEALLPSLDRGARSLEVLDVPAWHRGGLALSDLLVADRVAPLDSNANRWDEFLIEPNAGRFEPGAPVGLLWEVYGLTPDSTGVADYDVELRIQVEAIERKSTLAAIVGGIADAMGLTAVGEDRVRLRYRHTAGPNELAAHAEYLMLDLKNGPPGRYTLEVWVGTAGGEQASVTRSFTVGAEPVAR